MEEYCQHQSRGKRFQMTGANNEGENHKTRIQMGETDQQNQQEKLRGHSTNCQEGLLELDTNADKQAEAARIKELEADRQCMRSALKEKDEELKSLKDRIRELHADRQYMRSALKEKDEELKSFKDRVAEQVAPSIKTGTAMSLNSPVTKNRIKEMYEDLRCDWPEIKDRLKSTKDASNVKLSIQKKFENAKADMEKKKKHTDELFELNDKSVAPSPKNEQYRQSTIQNLQLAINNQKFVPGSKNTHDVMEYLTSQCYWLGCLMTLNNPPLQPDWEHHPPSMDKWDILPRNITVISEKNQDETQQQKTFCSSV